MRLLTVLLIAALAGCGNTALIRADYIKDGSDTKQMKADKNLCADEGLKTFWNTPASGQVASHFMQKQFYECMKAKGYEPVGVSTEIFKQKL